MAPPSTDMLTCRIVQIVVINETTLLLYTYNTVAIRTLSGKITPKTNLDKSNLVSRTLQAGPTSNTTVLYVDSVPPQRERACLDLFWT